MQALLIVYILTLVFSASAQSCDGTLFNDTGLNCYLYRDLSYLSREVSNDWTEASVDRCFAFRAALPDDEWIIKTDHYLPQNNNVTLTNIISNGECIEQCRKVYWCQSADFSEGYEKCHLQEAYGNAVPHVREYIDYIEKPQCYAAHISGPGSFDHFRLGLRLLVNNYFTEAGNNFAKAVELNPFSAMMYWGKSLALLLNNKETESRAVMTEYETRNADSRIYVSPSTSELAYLRALQNALDASNNEFLVLGDSFKAIFDSSAAVSRDVTAAYLAMVAYARGSYDSQRSTTLQAILQYDSFDPLAQLISLSTLAADRETVKQLTPSETNTLLGAINAVTTNSNGDPRSRFAAVRANFLLERYQETVDTAVAASEVINAAYQAGIADGTYTELTLALYQLQHRALVYMFDIAEAAQVVNQVDVQQNQLSVDNPNRALYQALYYDLLSTQYFAYWFTKEDKASLPSGSPDDVATVPNSTPLQRLSQLKLMIAIVMNNLEAPEAQRDVLYFSSVRDKLSNFIRTNEGTAIANIATINRNILQTVNALFNSNNWFTTRQEVVGDGGYLDEAIELYNQLSDEHKTLVVISPFEVTQYAIKFLSRNIPGPLPLIGALGIPDLPSLETSLSDPLFNTPSIQMSLAQVQFAMGKLSDAEATLLALQNSLDGLSPTWLQSALQVVRTTTIPRSALGVGSVVTVWGPVQFDDDTANLFNNLEQGWRWNIDATLYERCTAYYMENELSWPFAEGISIQSDNLKYYESATVEICRLRCLYETEFNCKAFTYGYGRCLLHDQSYNEVPSANRLSDLRDEQFYSLPDCPQASSDSHSLIQLGAKAIANGLTELALNSFDKVLDEYQANAPIALIMKALLLKTDPCTQDASSILPPSNAQLTDHEAKWRAVVVMVLNNNADGVGNALRSLLSAYPTDSIAVAMRNELDEDEALSDNPSFSWDKITKLNRLLNAGAIDWTVADNLINSLSTGSPSSPLNRYFNAWKSIKEGDWTAAKENSNSQILSEITAIRGFDDSTRPKAIMNMILQINHYSLIQKMELNAAKQFLIVQEAATSVGLRFLMFSQYSIVNRINQERLEQVNALDIDSTSCRNILGSRLIAAAMNAVQAYEVADPSVISIRRSAMENLITQGSEFTAWRKLADVFYALRDNPPRFAEQSLNDIPAGASVFSPVAFPRASYSSDITLAQPKLGLPLIDKSELYVWAMVESQSLDTDEEININLGKINEVLQRWPNRAVSLWLKFKIEQAAVFLMDVKRTENATRAAQNALTVWEDGDTDLAVAQALTDYINDPESQTTTTTPTTSRQVSDDMLEWWVIVVIVASGSILLAVVIISIAVHCGCRRRHPSKKLYSGSIHSISQSERGHPIVAPKGDIGYAGRYNDGMVETEDPQDFSG